MSAHPCAHTLNVLHLKKENVHNGIRGKHNTPKQQRVMNYATTKNGNTASVSLEHETAFTANVLSKLVSDTAICAEKSRLFGNFYHPRWNDLEQGCVCNISGVDGKLYKTASKTKH